MIRRLARRALYRRLEQRAAPLSPADLACPALVMAPHPDDETLGCGGLVATKRDAGARVVVVFMTDGGGSHPGFASRDALVARRREEALAACRILGVSDDDVHFLPFPDGGLEATDAAVAAVAAILDGTGVTQLVVPHPGEPPSDHHVTYRIAEAVSRRAGPGLDLLLYPVWLWDQWPFTNPLAPPRQRHSRRQILRVAARDRLGLGLLGTLTNRVDIGPVLARKQAALAAHASQTTRPADRPEWLTLADVAGGEWLELLLRPSELYGRGPVRSASGAS